MSAPYTITSVNNYNSNPPSDDGSQTASNRVQWSTQKTKLADPVYNAFNTSETNTSAAFGKVKGGAGFTSTAVNYTVTSGDQGKTVKATASAITITTPDATVVGSPFVFFVLNNSSGDITFAGNGTQTIDGSASFTIPAGCGVACNTDGSNWFTDGQNFNNVLQPPQGYLTLTTLTPIITGDVVSTTLIYYTPFQGDRAPISTDGATFKMRQIPELTLTLVSNHLASTIYDAFLFDNSGTTTIGTGPAWNNSGAGAGSRGTGAGTSELQRVHGLLTNKNSMTVRNGATTYTVAAGEGTYVGSIWIDSVAGQITCHRTYGQSRKWGVWNAWNRMPIVLRAGDSTPSWAYTTSIGVEPAHNLSANSLTTFTGLAEEEIAINYRIQALCTGSGSGGTGYSTNTTALGGVGVNSTAAFYVVSEVELFQSITDTSGFTSASVTAAGQIVTGTTWLPALGINTFTALEQTTVANNNPSITYYGAEGTMLLSASYRA